MPTFLDGLRTPQDLRALPVDRLPEVAAEIRSRIIAQVSKTGGHLAPNLGVVELTIALHYVFDFAHDRLVFDVGHQCYPHKLLTGRAGLLDGLRTRRGMAGFPEPSESAYDLFRVGHAGTGISTAVGLARGDALTGDAWDPRSRPTGRRVAVLIGDASIVNGVAMEGLNNAGLLRRQFLVVLNDNGMSISKPQGAIAQYFDRLRMSHLYADVKKGARRILRHVPGGSMVQDAYHRMGGATKAVLAEGAWFEHFGLVTVGPVDGHDLPTLIEFLAEAREFDRPMVLHVKTVKGKGFGVAEQDSSRFHSPPAFRVEPAAVPDPADGSGADRPVVAHNAEGCRVELAVEGRTFTSAVADALIDLMRRDPRVVACTAAMPDGTGLSKVLPAFPDRSWDTGICESHAMDMMAGMAKTGLRPFFAVYSTFLQRAFDQAFQEVALQGLAVRLLLDRAGLVGGDGAVHHGFCDIALLRTLPGACLLAAVDEPSLVAAMEFMRGYDDGLSAVRYPRDVVPTALADRPCPPFELGRARCLAAPDGGEAPHAAVLALGTPAIDALAAAASLATEYRVTVYDARFAKPVDAGLIRDLLSRRIPIVTVEDHSVIGGFGSAVVDAAQDMGLDASGVLRLGLPDAWIHQDPRRAQLAEAGIDAAGIAAAIRRAVGRTAPGHGPAALSAPQPPATSAGISAEALRAAGPAGL